MTGLAGADPATIVPGDVAGLRDLAATYRARSGTYEGADVEVRDLDLSEWSGPASCSAEARIGEIRANLQAAADAYLAAAGALEQYAYELEAAQSKAGEAVRSWQAAQVRLDTIGQPGQHLSLTEYYEATGPWVDQQTWAVDDVSDATSAVSTAAATAAAVLRDAARYVPVRWAGSILELLTGTPDRDDYTSDDRWATDFAAWARRLPDDEAGRQALREAVARLSTSELNRLLELRGYCTATGSYRAGADFLAALLVRSDLSSDPVYGDLYDAVQLFPDPAHHTYDPDDARDTRAAAAAVAAAWAGLTPPQRLAAARMYPWLVGSADGVGTVYRDVANRQVLAIDLAVTNAELNRVDQNLDAPGLSSSAAYGLHQERQSLTARLGFLDEVARLVEPSVPGDSTTPVSKYLVLLDPTVDGTGSHDQTGRAAVAWGNPDQATNVGVVVPGMTTYASSAGSLRSLVDNAGNVYSATAGLLPPGESAAVVAWIGYDAPGLNLEVATDERAHEGAFSLAAYEWGLEEAHVAETGQSPTMTTLAHSYGSVVAGATTHHDNPNDNLVVFGSPGTTVDHASELDIPDGHVFKALARDDVIDAVGWVEPFGNQPASQYSELGYGLGWGGTRIQTDAGDGTQGSSGHSEYLERGTESLRNMSAVVAGRYDLVTTIDERQTSAGLPGLPTLRPVEPEILAPAAGPYDPFKPEPF